MKLYTDYLNRIKEITIDSKFASFEKGLNLSERYLKEDYLFAESKKSIKSNDSLRTIADLLGIKNIKSPKCGDHPDFENLRKNGGFENHNIVSVFIDVKNSTRLFGKYTKEQIYFIIQTINLASTQTCALLGGHIQRMQFDGIFVYFGGKGIKKEDAIKQAITATALFTYFVKYELREVFQQNDIERIFTRIGIDFGDDNDVLWGIYGSDGCSELTTTSLHTSLAPKMQSKAESNGIMLGHNVFERLGINTDYCELKKDENGNIDYIFRNPDYKQYKFYWDRFLIKTYPFFKRDSSQNLFVDYNIAQQIPKRLESLERQVNILSSSNAYLHKDNQILPIPNENKISQNSFYYQ